MAYTPVIFFSWGGPTHIYFASDAHVYIYIHGCITAYIYIYAVIPHTALLSHSKLPQGKFLHRDSPTHASVFWSQLLHLMHSTRTQLFWSTLARPVPSETHLGKPQYDPGHCTVTQFQAVTELLIASAIFVESNNSISQILREFFAMRCHVEHPVVSMRELYSKNQIWTALKQDTNLYGPVKQTKTWTWWIGHVALHG